MHIRLYVDVARRLVDTRCRLADAGVTNIPETDSRLFCGLERFMRAGGGYANADSQPKPKLKPDAGKHDVTSKLSRCN